MKPFKNKFVKLDELLESFSHLELREFILQKIRKNKTDEIKLKTFSWHMTTFQYTIIPSIYDNVILLYIAL